MGVRLGGMHTATVGPITELGVGGAPEQGPMRVSGPVVLLLCACLALPVEAQLTPIISVFEAQLDDALAAADDGLGRSVAVSGETVALGVPGDDGVGGMDTGAVVIFVRSGGVWSQQARLTRPGASPGDAFGASVALSGDTLAVGAPKADGSRGEVHVYLRSGATWSRQQTLGDPGGVPGDSFGAALSLDGETLGVGTPGDDGAGVDRGAVHVHRRSGATWSLEQSLTAGDGADLDLFGLDVALEGDTLLVGAPLVAAPGAAGAGAAYVFVRSGTQWTEQQKLLPSLPQFEGRCGEAVALSGDTALLGAAGELGPFPGVAGAAYVFVRSGTTWSRQARLVTSYPTAGPRFGRDVALVEDTAVIVSSGLQDKGLGLGFTRAGSFWSHVLLFDDPAPAPFDGAGGTYAAFSGEFVLLAQPADDHAGGLDAGSARVWRLTRGPWDDLGGGCAGAGGVPVLTLGGVLAAGSPVDFALGGAAPSAPAWFVFSLQDIDAPFYCCALGPDPTPPLGSFITRTTTPAGGDALGATFPAGVPAGLTLDFQYVVADDSLGCAVTLSNVLRGTTF